MTTIKNEMKLNATPSQAFAALTTTAGINGWWAKDADIAAEIGGTHELRFVKGDNRVTMRFAVDELATDTKVRWTCASNDNPVWVGTTLTWDIQGNGDGCTVRFVHDGFSESESPPYKMTLQGWQHFFKSMTSYLETGTGEPW